MKVAIVQKRTSFTDTTAIDTFHSVNFHGMSVRQDDTPANTPSYRLGEHLLYPLQLTLNAYRINDIFQPRLNFIISEAVRPVLEGLQNVEMLEVQIRRTVYAEYQEGAFRHWDDPSYEDDGDGPERFIESLPDRPELADKLPKFYEVICPRLRDIAADFVDGKTVICNLGPTPFDEPFEGILSARMVHRYPLIRHGSHTIIRDDVFRELDPFLNGTYFLKAEVEIS